MKSQETKIELPDAETVGEAISDAVVETIKLPFKVVNKLWDWIFGFDEI